MLINAKEKTLSQTNNFGLPDVSRAVARLLQPVIFEIMQKSIGPDGRVQNIPLKIKTQASVQPFKSTMLKIKPEADRAWSWWWIHSLTNLEVAVNDRIVYKGIKLKVMEKSSFNDYGYFEYHCIEDTQRS